MRVSMRLSAFGFVLSDGSAKLYAKPDTIGDGSDLYGAEALEFSLRDVEGTEITTERCSRLVPDLSGIGPVPGRDFMGDFDVTGGPIEAGKPYSLEVRGFGAKAKTKVTVLE
jgi:hypothetical protein